MKLIFLMLALLTIVCVVMYFNGMGKAVVEKCVYPERHGIMGHYYKYWEGRGYKQGHHRWRGDTGSP